MRPTPASHPPGDAGAALPYHLADVPVASTVPLFSAFRQLLALPGSRETAPALLDFLAQPDVARRLGLDADALALLERALAEARAAWGLDPAARAALGVPAIEEHTLAWAMDRLLASLVHGNQDSDDLMSVAGRRLAPVTGVAGAALALGALDQLLQGLATLREDATRPRAASALRCEATANASWSSRLMFHSSATFSAVTGFIFSTSATDGSTGGSLSAALACLPFLPAVE